MFLFVHACNRQARFDPSAHCHDFSVGDCIPRLQIALAEAEASVPLRPLGGVVRQLRDGEIASIRMPGSGGPPAIDPQLPEIPSTLAHRRNIGSPQLLALDSDLLPAGNGPPPTQDRQEAVGYRY